MKGHSPRQALDDAVDTLGLLQAKPYGMCFHSQHDLELFLSGSPASGLRGDALYHSAQHGTTQHSTAQGTADLKDGSGNIGTGGMGNINMALLPADPAK